MGRRKKYDTLAAAAKAQRDARLKYEQSEKGRAVREKYKLKRYPRVLGSSILPDGPQLTPSILAKANLPIPVDDPHFRKCLEGDSAGLHPYDLAPPYPLTYFEAAPRTRPFKNVGELEAMVLGSLLRIQKERDKDRVAMMETGKKQTTLLQWTKECHAMVGVFEQLLALEDSPAGDEYTDAMVKLHCGWTALQIVRLRNLECLKPPLL
ncbi:hypothetical protein MKEN_00423200 [Mycena kentingensis (nom. inval.)]|nr:hypothetical protein MKEN_00423200 [Mycena kentingensis (nom. inval.)]